MATENILNSKTSTELPSIKDSLLKPKNLLVGFIISIVLNFILLCSAIFASQSGTSQQQVVPTLRRTPSPKPIITTRPSALPTIAPDEKLSELVTCFQNCQTNDLITKISQEAENVKEFKTMTYLTFIEKKNCYINFVESSGLNEFHAFSKYDCDEGYISNPPQNYIHVLDNMYILNNSGNWNLESKSRNKQTKLSFIMSELNSQPDKEATKFDPSNKYRTVTAKGQVINSSNQLVNKTVTIQVNQFLEINDYSIDIETVSLEEGSIYSHNVVNDVKAPTASGN